MKLKIELDGKVLIEESVETYDDWDKALKEVSQIVLKMDWPDISPIIPEFISAGGAEDAKD